MLHEYIFVYLTFKLKITIMEKLIQEPVPRPIAPIECACGCGHEFQPRRRDQKYLNKQHADYGYNHKERKKKDKQQVLTNLKLKANNKILDKYFNAFKDGLTATCNLDSLVADGFDKSYSTGVTDGNYNGKITQFYFSYNYIYFINYENQIKIKKR